MQIAGVVEGPHDAWTAGEILSAPCRGPTQRIAGNLRHFDWPLTGRRRGRAHARRADPERQIVAVAGAGLRVHVHLNYFTALIACHKSYLYYTHIYICTWGQQKSVVLYVGTLVHACNVFEIKR